MDARYLLAYTTREILDRSLNGVGKRGEGERKSGER